ncbi:MAG: WYL domain-containing protein [Eubacterium sp.]|nr:WYL domain-containing protein [Candidatus Colimonas fimequi]
MAKVVGSKLRTLYIMQMLLEKSDQDHRISVADISEMLEGYDIKADRKSIYADIGTLTEWGMDILYTKEKPAGWYVASREFELPELKLLVDAVQASKFITHKKSQDLIKKLEKLASESEAKQLQRNVVVANRIKTPNEGIYYNVDTIHEAILANVQIQFTYYAWTIDKELVAKRDGKPYTVSPWALTWDDENYYLIAYEMGTKLVKHYRVDKMKNIKLTKKAREGRDNFSDFDIAGYAKKTFGMFGGETENVILECANHMIGPILDRFGTDNIIMKVDDDKFQIQQQVSVSGQFYGWIVGLGPDVKIVHPPKVVAEFKNRIERINQSYE